MTGLLEKWTFVAMAWSREIIVPDGCRDLVLTRHRNGSYRHFVSELQTAPRYAEIPEGSSMVGFRLKPGATLDIQAFFSAVREYPDDADRVGMLVNEISCVPDDIDQMLTDLASGAQSVALVAKRNGDNPRRLQRRFKQAGLPPPAFWHVLARVRRCAVRIGPSTGLADLALEEGFADQSHMTREFRRWLGFTPAVLRADQRLQDLMHQSGLGTERTGEQISMR